MTQANTAIFACNNRPIQHCAYFVSIRSGKINCMMLLPYPDYGKIHRFFTVTAQDFTICWSRTGILYRFSFDLLQSLTLIK